MNTAAEIGQWVSNPADIFSRPLVRVTNNLPINFSQVYKSRNLSYSEIVFSVRVRVAKRASVTITHNSYIKSWLDLNSIIYNKKDCTVAYAAKQVLHISIRVEKLRSEMIKLAKQTPEFPAVDELYGVGETLASKLIAEVQDPRRFVDKSALVAYAGVDPGKDDSGKKVTKSGKISGTGNALLRKTAYQIVECHLLKSPADELVYQFLDKKRSEGKNYNVYMTAACNKFLRIYYARISECEYLNSLESGATAYVSETTDSSVCITTASTAKNNNAFTCRQDSATQECDMSGLQGLAYTNGAVSEVSCDN